MKKTEKNEEKKEKKEGTMIKISEPNFQVGYVWVRGLKDVPYVAHAWGQKAQQEMRAKQEAGSLSLARGKKKAAKDFNALYEGARHRSADGWDGIPAMGFKNAILSVGKLLGIKSAYIKMCIFIISDGMDLDGYTPLVRIRKVNPEKFESMVRIGAMVKTSDISVRAKYMNWYARIAVRYDADFISAADIGKLLSRAGIQSGIGEGRATSTNSAGMGWGMFEIVKDGKEVEELDAALERGEI